MSDTRTDALIEDFASRVAALGDRAVAGGMARTDVEHALLAGVLAWLTRHHGAVAVVGELRRVADAMAEVDGDNDDAPTTMLN